MLSRSFVRLRPRAHQFYFGQDRIVMATASNGFIHKNTEEGLFVHETRLLSHYRVTINGAEPTPIALSKVAEHTWHGYYAVEALSLSPTPTNASVEAFLDTPDMGSGMMEALSENTLELRISRFIGSNVHEDLDLTNHSFHPIRFQLAIELDADFADLIETRRPRIQHGVCTRQFVPIALDAWELVFNYRASHAGKNLERGLNLRIHRTPTEPRTEDNKIIFDITLNPHETWHCCFDYIPILELDLSPKNTRSAYQCYAFDTTNTLMDQRRIEFLERATICTTHNHSVLTPIVEQATRQATEDLISLRLHDLDVDETSWTLAAGHPQYVALFGRDTLTTAWQAAMLDTGMLTGTLTRLAQLQGTVVDNWRDEEPGRLLHEAHTGPLEILNYNPRERYYGSNTTSALFPMALSSLWHWTGDKKLVQKFIPTALRALKWLDQYADLDGDGLYEYLSRSSQGTKHQAWKDSPTAMVYANGHIAEPPIATCEEQGFAYMSKYTMAELLWSLGDPDTARRLFREAASLKQKFLDAFWMPDENFLAMALDEDKNQLRSIASNAGHCLATGIIDADMARPIADRLLADDMFSGWGVRTLSSLHPAYNPFSYHRGSVWPVENGTFTLGFFRYGLFDHAHKLSKAIFEATDLFESNRLPEVFSGHPRNSHHPFPAFYPHTCAPQAWSASAIFSLIQSLCGFYPYAPLKMLVVDPHLPDWLPEIRLTNLKVGQATATIHFFRKENGASDYYIEQLDGPLHVIHQPSPWSLTASTTERLSDAFSSFLPHH